MNERDDLLAESDRSTGRKRRRGWERKIRGSRG
jgi:hypothetical protein